MTAPDALYHGSTGLLGDAFDRGTWCTADLVEAIYYARRKGGDCIYVFCGRKGLRRHRKYYRLAEPRKPDFVLRLEMCM